MTLQNITNMNRKTEEDKPRRSSSFLNKFSLFKSQRSSDSDGDSKSTYFASAKSNQNKKSIMEREWSKACGQMDKRAQILQECLIFLFISSKKVFFRML